MPSSRAKDAKASESNTKDSKAPTPGGPSRGGTMQANDPLVGTKMRVWWPPTTNKDKTGFAGAYWPVKVLQKKKNRYTVEYDNGEQEDVLTENLAPDDPPVDFGQESSPLQQGEFCEVSNASRTDPCAWVAVVSKRLPTGEYGVTYPFHDSPAENIPAHLIRRARVLDMEGWCLLKPGQKWKDGDVLSPHELETIKEEELTQFLKKLKQPVVDGKAKETRNGNSSAAATDGKGSKRGAPAPAAKTTPARPTQKPRL